VRIFLAGASGVIGRLLVPLLVDAGHSVAGMTRSADKADGLRELGAETVVCDVFDAPVLERGLGRLRARGRHPPAHRSP
jgi:nucleoside-diphosphate-sugar epimerase